MTEKRAEDVHLVVFACEAGMGSSLIGANQLKKRVKDAGLGIRVIHSPVNQIPADTDVVIASYNFWTGGLVCGRFPIT